MGSEKCFRDPAFRKSEDEFPKLLSHHEGGNVSQNVGKTQHSTRLIPESRSHKQNPNDKRGAVRELCISSGAFGPSADSETA
jgi:hypothetical protein